MRIYTRRGDQGETGLLGGARVSKTDPRIEVCGALDETNAALGLARALGLAQAVDSEIGQIQEDLLLAGAEAARPGTAPAHIAAEDVARLERTIDAHQEELRPLEGFIVPGGTPGPAALHLARSLCRRAERSLVAAGGQTREGSALIAYLNRLSDLLFVLARHANALDGVAEVTWGPRDPRTRG